MAIILYFLVTMVESSSETSLSVSNSTYGERAVLYSFEIDVDGVEISLLYQFGAGSPRVTRGARARIFWSKWCRAARSSSIRVIQSTSWSYWDVVMGWVWLLRLVCSVGTRLMGSSELGQVGVTGLSNKTALVRQPTVR